jgi:glutaredoxin 2
LSEAQAKLVLGHVLSVKEADMTTQTIQIQVPNILLERARVRALAEAQELITFLLENYIQELEKTQRQQAYEAYYAARTPEDEAEELELLADFAFADAEITNSHPVTC